MALSLYRKYRPEVFSDVIGQEHVEKTLLNAISEGAVAHAYLFCGPRGTGKTTTARLLAKALLCEASSNGEPDGTCATCQEVSQGAHPDVFELDAASRTGVDNVREEIIGRVGFAPTRGKYKVYIIDEVHMLSTAAFNALLKTLEEPPEHVVFVLCTTDPHKVPETIQSRCQRFDFRRFSIEEIVSYLQRISEGEGFTVEPQALEFIAAKSAGGMRDATTALEQVSVYTEGNITLDEASRMFGQIDMQALFEISGYIAQRDTPSCFIWVNDLVGKGVDLSQFAKDLASHIRNIYVTAITGGENGIVACTKAQLEQYKSQAQEFGGVNRLSRALDICGSLVSELRGSTDPRLSVEIAMTRLTCPESELTLEALAERIENLEMRPSLAVSAIQAEAQSTSSAVPVVVPVEAGAAAEAAAVSEPAVPDDTLEETPSAVPEEASSAAPAETSEVEQSSASPSSSSGAPSMSPDRLMAAVLSVVKREEESVAALLSGVSMHVENGMHHLLFPSGSEFQLRIASGPDSKTLISKAFEEILGHPATFDFQIGSTAAQKPAAKPGFDSAPSPDEPPIDAAYYDSLAAQDDSAPYAAQPPHAQPDAIVPDDDPSTADMADLLSAFGSGVKVQEIKNEE